MHDAPHRRSRTVTAAPGWRSPAGGLLLGLLAAACSAAGPEQIDPQRPPREAATDGGGAALDAGGARPADAATVPAKAVDAGVAAEAVADGGAATRPPVEARGVWVTRWDYRTAADVERIIEQLAAAGFNQVYFQVRGAADAYYRSTREPWAAALSGKLGRDPGWDPLQTAIAAAHGRGLELHAWINVCTGWKGARPPGRAEPKHLMRAHPQWRVRDRRGRPMPYSDGGYVFLNPAHPAFGRHLEAVVGEIASFYAIDGLHLDYARYPGRQYSHDRVSRRRFRAARREQPELDRGDWQRRELTRLVARLKQRVIEVRPRAVVSAAVTGIYRDRWGWGQVTQGWADFYQDSHAWAEQGAVDALLPMIYWPPTAPAGEPTDFATLVADFAPLAERVQLLAGINVEAGDFAVLEREIALARAAGLHGVVLFAYRALVERGWLERLAAGPFARPARPPDPPPREAAVGWGRLHRLGLRIALRATSTISSHGGWSSAAWLSSLAPSSTSTASASPAGTCPARAPRQ
jgi:uncharacterized lipoprotein YddW (UPF0748 family)